MALVDSPSSFSPQERQERLATGTSAATQNGTHTRNVVLFGETGVGKSSLINLLADKLLAETSNDALGCTLEPRCYDIAFPLDSGRVPESESVVNVTLWDTAGLDEGTYGAVPASAAASRLKALLHTLARSPAGVHLLLFCIQGTRRLTRALAHQYNLVCADVCYQKVPVALVVTGLEHLNPEEPAAVGMGGWWTIHAAEVRQLGMKFVAHACLTTAEVGVEGIGQERRVVSQRQLRKLIISHACQETAVAWRIGPSWQSVVMSMLRDLWVHIHKKFNGFKWRGCHLRRYCAALRRWLANVANAVARSEGNN